MGLNVTASATTVEAEAHKTGPSHSAFRVAAWALAAVAIVIGAEAYLTRDADKSEDIASQLTRPMFGPGDYDAALADSSARVAAKQEMLAMFKGDWVREEALAYALADRFRLTGDYADLANAAEVVARGRAEVEAPAGPLLADAEIAMAGHRLGVAEAALRDFSASVSLEPEEEVAAAALAGDVAFYRGDMAAAASHYAAAGAQDPAAVRVREAIIAKAQGHYDEALAKLRESLAARRRPTPFAVATFALQCGAIELARGNSAAARRYFERADAIFPGYWLTEAHLAQADAIDGHADKAIAAMRRVAEKGGSAEAMDALAMLLRTFGRPDESRAWAARASAAWQRRLEAAPEAAYGHAVEHELVFGSPARALDLASRNLASRPFGESRLLMANALMLNGRTGDALAQLQAAEASGWRSAPLYALRATLLELAGREAEGEAARKAALALNPHILEPQTVLVWFSHG